MVRRNYGAGSARGRALLSKEGVALARLGSCGCVDLY